MHLNFQDMEDKVLATLKFSYDSLENDTARMSFLYCSLYPADKLLYKDNIIGLWIGEGFLDEFEDLEDARDMIFLEISRQLACWKMVEYSKTKCLLCTT